MILKVIQISCQTFSISNASAIIVLNRKFSNLNKYHRVAM